MRPCHSPARLYFPTWHEVNLSSRATGAPKRCALLSTAGSLLYHERGREIDAHDLVIRTGQAPVHGFARYVGHRTDYRIMSVSLYESVRKMNVSRTREELARETILYTKLPAPQCGKIKEWHRQHKITRPYVCLGVGRPQCNVATRWSRHFSSGFESVFIALLTLNCTHITLLGFNSTENLNAPYHYWADGSYHDSTSARQWYKDRGSTRYGHDFLAEQRVLASATRDSVLTRQSLAAVCDQRQ